MRAARDDLAIAEQRDEARVVPRADDAREVGAEETAVFANAMTTRARRRGERHAPALRVAAGEPWLEFSKALQHRRVVRFPRGEQRRTDGRLIRKHRERLIQYGARRRPAGLELSVEKIGEATRGLAKRRIA